MLIKVYGTGFFAREDTVTPVRIAILCVVVNLVLNLALMGPLGHVGIALATAISAWLNAALLVGLLRRRFDHRADRRLRRAVPRIVLASVVMGLALWGGMAALGSPLGGAEATRAGALAVLIAGGVLVYGTAVIVLGAARIEDLRRRLSG